ATSAASSARATCSAARCRPAPPPTGWGARSCPWGQGTTDFARAFSRPMTQAYAVPIPSDCMLAPLYVGADLLDAYAIHLPAGASDDPEVLARVAFERQAAGDRALAWVRDTGKARARVKSARASGRTPATPWATV